MGKIWNYVPFGELILLVVTIFLCLTPPCFAITVTLEWDASPEADYYVVHWGPSSRNYTANSGNIGNVITYDLNLPDGRDNYVAVVAWDNIGLKSTYSREVSVLDPGSLDAGYDRGWAITAGDLKGFKVMYDSKDVTPTLGPSSDIPTLKLPDVNPLGLPINLQPSPTYFNTPVKIYIPCPDYSDLSEVYLYYYDTSGNKWMPADDVNDWIVPDSLEDHYETNPHTVAIKVKHFSAVQAGAPVSASASPAESGGGGGGGCFIATAAR